MFDISFSELLVIAFVALVVIGPEKLPKVARTAGAFFGRMQRFITQVKDEVNREARFAELQKLQDEVKSSLQEGMQEVERSILPSVAPDIASPEPASDGAKKPRQPRQRKIQEAVLADATSLPPTQLEAQPQPSLASDPQAQLFADSDMTKKPTRRARKLSPKLEDAGNASEQKIST